MPLPRGIRGLLRGPCAWGCGGRLGYLTPPPCTSSHFCSKLGRKFRTHVPHYLDILYELPTSGLCDLTDSVKHPTWGPLYLRWTLIRGGGGCRQAGRQVGRQAGKQAGSVLAIVSYRPFQTWFVPHFGGSAFTLKPSCSNFVASQVKPLLSRKNKTLEKL